MKWVTWENVGVDRMGSAWLIRQFIDPKATFTFIPRGTQASAKDGEPFDLPNVRFSHHRGHCTFHALVKRYKLKDPILNRMARMVDEADTVQEAKVEEAAAGLDLVCRGIRQTSANDATALQRGAEIYDAIYAALAADAAGTDISRV